MSLDVEQWRGIAADSDAERSAAEAPDAKTTIRLRAASRALLASLLRPHRGLITVMVLLLLLQNAAGSATLDVLETTDALERANTAAEAIRQGMREILSASAAERAGPDAPDPDGGGAQSPVTAELSEATP